VALLPERASLDARPVPGWYTDAKLGIFVHWGLYSIPAFAARTDGDYAEFMGDLAAGKDTGAASPTPSGTSTRCGCRDP
jgi:alpha-L-fucosidase